MPTLVESIRPGDVINIESTKDYKKIPWWKRPFYLLGTEIIRADQRAVFGKASNWKDHHSVIFFDRDKVFSVEPPHPLFKTLDEYAPERLSVYRWTTHRFKDEEVAILFEPAQKIVTEGADYDFGQLADFLCSTISGYPFWDKNKIFDQGGKNLVCSVGVASCFNYFRHEFRAMFNIDLPQPFSRLNPGAWSQKFQAKFAKVGHWDIDRTFPANYANTRTHFAGEFELVGTFENGNSI